MSKTDRIAQEPPAVGSPLDGPVGRLAPERAVGGLRRTVTRHYALQRLADGSTTHPGSQGLAYMLERAGLTQWDADGNRYLLTEAGRDLLAQWGKPPNVGGQRTP